MIEGGKGEAQLGNLKYEIFPGVGIVVAGGTLHNIKNTSLDQHLKLYTLYAPPKHSSGSIELTK